MSTFGWSHGQAGSPARGPDVEPLSAGTMVTPHVRLAELLGEGAMGSVWVADHLTLTTRVAVKFIAAERVDDSPQAVERFRREARIAAQIKSPYVVQIFDSGVTEHGTPYIVMEHLEGEPLGKRLEREGALGPGMAALVVEQVGKALRAAHKLDIVHRDIKPDNIFLIRTDEGLQCKVLDFGVARHAGSGDSQLTSSDSLVGTVEFMSPEQIMDASRADFRADLWGLAAVVYCVVTGAIPFDGDDLGELCQSILDTRFPLPSEVLHRDSAELDAWFEQAFHPEIDRRFGSAEQMAAAFAALVPAEAREQAGQAAATDPATAAVGDALAGRALTPAEPAVTDLPTRPGFRERRAAFRARTLLIAAGVAVLLAAVIALVWAGGGEGEDGETATSRAAASGATATASATAASTEPTSAPQDVGAEQGSDAVIDASAPDAATDASASDAASTASADASSEPASRGRPFRGGRGTNRGDPLRNPGF